MLPPELPPPPRPFPGLTSQHFLSIFAIAECVQGEFGGNPFSSSDGLWFFLKLLSIGSFGNQGFFYFPVINQHRIGPCGPEKLLEYKSCCGPSTSPPTGSLSFLRLADLELFQPRLQAASSPPCLQEPGPRNEITSPSPPCKR